MELFYKECTFQDFIEFVNSQPEDKKIDHACTTTCALGDWQEERFGTRELLCYPSGHNAREFLPRKVADTVLRISRATYAVPTYGDLQDFLELYRYETD